MKRPCKEYFPCMKENPIKGNMTIFILDNIFSAGTRLQFPSFSSSLAACNFPTEISHYNRITFLVHFCSQFKYWIRWIASKKAIERKSENETFPMKLLPFRTFDISPSDKLQSDKFCSMIPITSLMKAEETHIHQLDTRSSSFNEIIARLTRLMRLKQTHENSVLHDDKNVFPSRSRANKTK